MNRFDGLEVNGHEPEVWTAPTPIERFTARQLIEQHPRLNPPVVGNLIRQAEVLNIISVSKIGKSWLLYSLLLSITTGRPWLGIFPTARGRCLLIDNELHRSVLAHRLRTVAEALSISEDEYGDDLDVWPLRGYWRNLHQLSRELEDMAGVYQMIAVDAIYRALPDGTSENDNGQIAALYNAVDQIAGLTQAAFALIHHSSKGGQADKRVTDVGSGAGSQSRAADTHLILREHEDGDAVVMDGALRSFEPMSPKVLRWSFPLWTPDHDADPIRLKGKQSPKDEAQSKLDAEADGDVLNLCVTWCSRSELETKTGWNRQRVNRAIARLLKANLLEESKQERPGVKKGTMVDVFRKTIHAR